MQLVRAVFTSQNIDAPSKEIEYVYDAVGNRIREIINGVAGDYTVNTMNQYNQAGDFLYSYDADGNLISKTDGADSPKSGVGPR